MITALLVILGVILILPVGFFISNRIDDLRYRFRPILLQNKNTPFYNWHPEDLGEGMHPWGAVLRSDYVGSLPLKLLARKIKPCRFCAEEASSEAHNHLTWVYFTSHPRSWRIACGREGYIAICTRHKNQVDFICTRMN